MSMEKKIRFIPTVAVILVSFLAGAIFVLGGYLAYDNYSKDLADAQTGSMQNAIPASVSVNSDKLPDIAGIVKNVSPAVVYIETLTQSSNQGMNPYFNDPFYREFFGNQMPHGSRSRAEQGIGSGFIINKEGYIITNEHVVHSASEINVTVAGFDKPFKAEVIGSDYELDLAVIKIDAGKDLPSLTLGDSDTVNVGEWAIAIGSPYGLDHTVTLGVISAKGRPVTVSSRQFKNLLQTDAAINPGNSGGPLLNLAGEVVGINTAVSAEAQGIGFAIPTATVKDVLKELIENGKVTRPYMGVYIQNLDSESAKYYGAQSEDGALIEEVVNGSPADKAGLRAGDIVLAVNGKSVKTSEELQELIRESKVNARLNLKILREGDIKNVTVVLGEK